MLNCLLKTPLTFHREHALYYMPDIHLNILCIICSCSTVSSASACNSQRTHSAEYALAYQNILCYMLDINASFASVYASHNTPHIHGKHSRKPQCIPHRKHSNNDNHGDSYQICQLCMAQPVP